jgi:hypothetical protein
MSINALVLSLVAVHFDAIVIKNILFKHTSNYAFEVSERFYIRLIAFIYKRVSD